MDVVRLRVGMFGYGGNRDTPTAAAVPQLRNRRMAGMESRSQKDPPYDDPVFGGSLGASY